MLKQFSQPSPVFSRTEKMELDYLLKLKHVMVLLTSWDKNVKRVIEGLLESGDDAAEIIA